MFVDRHSGPVTSSVRAKMEDEGKRIIKTINIGATLGLFGLEVP